MSASRTTRTVVRTAAALAVGVVAPMVFGVPSATAADRDRDGMPDRWERRHGLDPRVDDARRDLDRDGLRNIGEWRRGARPEVEDSDDDGHDDGDEVADGVRGTDVDDPDTDDDGTPDGDEDADHDGTDNEDEDDGDESCRRDDDDHDGDHVDDEDENELGLSDDDADSDDDGIEDGDDDSDDDGEADEDGDDSLEDRCGRDDDEDVDDLVGTIVSFEESTGTLVVDRSVGEDLEFLVTDDTEIEIEIDDSGPDDDARRGDEEGSTDDLTAGVLVKEVDIDHDLSSSPPTLEEIEIYGPGASPGRVRG